ncbi:uncharacterized protein A1O5_07680 [Cladophialophora psammophila CBS 110553]|uniref:Uncharacterized protein n=1 Tax=Cladophialophora psammophila CBS 110553 TaxID=1182543 RepID=W9XH09_9EURO|nr:uncharacterized protein A1O5_07680 [Cladophialophora psammophila CBS 110553]EXJ69644.1 hypothetical protein A1O5_07680 [Cladophialophora psammophila CBS 110553]
MPPKATKHKQNRLNVKKNRQLQQKMENLKAADDTSQDTGSDVTKPDTTITPTKQPLFETWEKVEAGWFLPETLAVLVNVAAPQARRLTREVQSDIELM